MAGRVGWVGEELHSMLDIIRRVCSHYWGEYFLKGKFSIFMDITDDLRHLSEQIGSLWVSLESSTAWKLQMKNNDPSSSTMGEETRESAEASKRNITNKSLSPHLPSKSKWENKNMFFWFFWSILRHLLATDLRDEAPSCSVTFWSPGTFKKSLSKSTMQGVGRWSPRKNATAHWNF